MANQIKYYGPVGKCIYCGRNDVPLSDEHIVPYGLSGKFILRKASCQSCSEKTSLVERRVLRNHLIAPRAAMDLKTRRPSQRPTKFPITLFRQNPKGEVREERVSSPSDQPVLLALPIYKPPQFLVDPTSSSSRGIDSPLDWKVFLGGKKHKEFIAEIIADGYEGVEFDLDVHLADFALMMAKIGYSYTRAILPGDFLVEDYISPLIIGKTNDIGRYVGNLPTHELAGDSIATHRLAVQIMLDRTVIARVKLFAKIGTPEYIVVVGKTDKENLPNA